MANTYYTVYHHIIMYFQVKSFLCKSQNKHSPPFGLAKKYNLKLNWHFTKHRDFCLGMQRAGKMLLPPLQQKKQVEVRDLKLQRKQLVQNHLCRGKRGDTTSLRYCSWNSWQRCRQVAEQREPLEAEDSEGVTSSYRLFLQELHPALKKGLERVLKCSLWYSPGVGEQQL